MQKLDVNTPHACVSIRLLALIHRQSKVIPIYPQSYPRTYPPKLVSINGEPMMNSFDYIYVGGNHGYLPPVNSSCPNLLEFQKFFFLVFFFGAAQKKKTKKIIPKSKKIPAFINKPQDTSPCLLCRRSTHSYSKWRSRVQVLTRTSEKVIIDQYNQYTHECLMVV